MKMLRSLSVLFLPLTAALALSAAPVESTITAVTVYADRAVVTRTASVELAAGPGELVFANLPESLNEQSLQVSGRGTAGATILDVSAKRTYTENTPNERVQALEEQLRGLGKQVRGLDDRTQLLNVRAASLDRIEASLFAPPAKDVPRGELEQMNGALTYLTEQRTKIAAERATIDDERADLDRKITAATNQLNELRGGGRRRAFKTVTVRVVAAQAGRTELSLSYTVGGASWVPSYDARVTSGERSVSLGYFGLVRQGTGEDWKDVALTLSTARPSLGGEAPKLEAWSVEVVDPTIKYKQELGEVRMRGARPAAAPVMALADSAGFGTAAGGPPEEKELNVAVATVDLGSTSATFKIAAATSIPSDNSPQKVPITNTALNAQPEYATTPKRQTTAFLTSKVYNNSEFPLLPGAMNVFLDGTFVATSKVATVMPGERFDLALGADEGISVKHKRVSRFVELTGLTNSGTRFTYEFQITVQNNKRTAERVVVSDQVPLSRHEKIIVKQLVPTPTELKPDNEGLLKWTLDLKPGEKRELTVKFSIEHPNDVIVTGLE